MYNLYMHSVPAHTTHRMTVYLPRVQGPPVTVNSMRGGSRSWGEALGRSNGRCWGSGGGEEQEQEQEQGQEQEQEQEQQGVGTGSIFARGSRSRNRSRNRIRSKKKSSCRSRS